MSVIIEHVPANLVLPGWSVRVDDQWWSVIMVAETEHVTLGRRFWFHVLDREKPIIVMIDEEVEVRREDPSA